MKEATTLSLGSRRLLAESHEPPEKFAQRVRTFQRLRSLSSLGS